MRIIEKPRPSEHLLDTKDVLAVRLPGRPRDPEDARHKSVVIFASPTTTPHQLALHLRDAARALDPTL